MVKVLLTTASFNPWILTFASVVVAICSLAYAVTKDSKKESKECAIDTTTVIVKLENIQTAVSRTSDIVSGIQSEMKNMDRRLTRVEERQRMESGD